LPNLGLGFKAIEEGTVLSYMNDCIYIIALEQEKQVKIKIGKIRLILETKNMDVKPLTIFYTFFFIHSLML